MAYHGQVCSRHEVCLCGPPGKFRVDEPPWVSSSRFIYLQRHLVAWFSNDGCTRNQIDLMLMRSRWASSVIDCRPYNGPQTGNEHGSDYAMGWAHQRLRLKAARISNRSATLDTAKLKTLALKHLDLWSRFKGFAARRGRLLGRQMMRAQMCGRRRFSGTSRKNAKSLSRLGHWWNDCVGRASALCEDSKCTKSPGSEKANNWSTTTVSWSLLEGTYGIERDGGGL